jgi:hypothetical protein
VDDDGKLKDQHASLAKAFWTARMGAAGSTMRSTRIGGLVSRYIAKRKL